jgi:hypothetical protein
MPNPNQDYEDPLLKRQQDELINALDPASADPFADGGATDGMPTRSPNDPGTQFPGPSDDWGSGTTTGPDGQTGGQDPFVTPDAGVGTGTGAGTGTASPIYTQDPNSAAYRGTTSTGTATSTSGIPNLGTSAMSKALQDYLTSTISSDPYDVSNDPGVRAASEAYRNSAERSLASNREAMAERMNAEGTMGGGLDSWVANAYQGMGESVAANDVQLVLNRQAQKLGQLQNALTTGAGLLTGDQEAAIRMQIANLQNALGQGQLDYQGKALDYQDAQFYANLNDYLRYKLELDANQGLG